MVSLAVLYPNTADSHFDMTYYLDRHTPLVKERLTPLGLINVDLREGLAGGSPDSPAAYTMITNLTFSTMEELQNGLATHGDELIGDIPNFTNVQAEMQICQVR
ncbi:EthD family reductase [uncultured Fibrella sp.]|uniref:EthD family reductase n=1 Tax=uncultured Fibrella sp. TaxID=1284596 RepID=UPI0035CA713A